MASRRADSEVFGAIAHALLKRYRLIIQHLNRRTGEVTERTVSPQRLAHYRDNWYLDAWCHLRGGLRSFAVDAIASAQVEETEAAKNVSAAELERFWVPAMEFLLARRPVRLSCDFRRKRPAGCLERNGILSSEAIGKMTGATR